MEWTKTEKKMYVDYLVISSVFFHEHDFVVFPFGWNPLLSPKGIIEFEIQGSSIRSLCRIQDAKVSVIFEDYVVLLKVPVHNSIRLYCQSQLSSNKATVCPFMSCKLFITDR